MIYSNQPQPPKRPATGLTKQLLSQPANYVQQQPAITPSQNVLNLASMARQNAPDIKPSLSSIDVVGGIPFAYTRDEPRKLRKLMPKSRFEKLGEEAIAPTIDPRAGQPVAKQGDNTSVKGVTRQLIDGIPIYSNVPNENASGLGTIPSMRQNSPSLKDILQSATSAQMPVYNAGTQATVVEDATRGGYYQRRRADNANKKTIERLNNQGKERFAIDRQTALDNDQLQTNSLSRRLLGSNVTSTERIGELERMMSDFNLPEQQRLAAMQTRNLLMQAAQKAQNNVVTKLSEELADGTKRERAVTIDPNTGQELSNVDWEGIDLDQYVTEYANRTGRTKEDVLKQLGLK